jgi:hypothetical protein
VIKASQFSGKKLRHLLRNRLPMLKDDSDATVVIWMLSISRAITDKIENLS